MPVMSVQLRIDRLHPEQTVAQRHGIGSVRKFVASLATSLCAAFGIIADVTAADRPTAISLPDCRIKVIDQVTLASDRNGILEVLEVHEGDAIERGGEVARLRDETARAQLAVARKKAENDIEVRYSRTAAGLARLEFEKAEEANRKTPGAIAHLEVEKLRLAAERALLQIEQSEHQFALAGLEFSREEADLRTYKVLSPIQGVVTKLHKQRGEAIRYGDPIIEVTSTDRVRVEAYVNMERLLKIRLGDPVAVRLVVPELELQVESEIFEGHITFIDVVAQPVTNQIKIWAEVKNVDNLLRAGLTGEMVVFASGGAQAPLKTQQTNKTPKAETPPQPVIALDPENRPGSLSR